MQVAMATHTAPGQWTDLADLVTALDILTEGGQ